MALVGWGVLLAGNVAAAAEDLSVFSPATRPASSIRDLFFLVLGIAGVILLIVEGLIFYCAYRFRQRRGEKSEPPQIYGSTPIEVAWTVAPLLTVFVLFLVVVRSVTEVRGESPPADSLRVIAIGHQWWWEFVYPDLGIRTANELYIPCREEGSTPTIALELQSADVIHSFWVPRLGGKTDHIPGRTNRMWFDAPERGAYHGQCAEYCGTQHANMKLLVVAESAEEFRLWHEQERREANHEAAVDAGRERFLALNCINCHTIRGTAAAGTVGPDLTHLMARRTLAAGACVNDHEHLTQWLADPDAIKPGSEMPNLHLSRQDVDLIVAYLSTLH
ncbi:MAG: cytochrome c oxidase subunit II [Planctomycetaceae bacterium]|nr:cytochrome c oxidase subunit II [Planctomycetaceae bacterium]